MSNQKMIMPRLNSFGEYKRSRDSRMAEADEGVENKTCRDGAIDTRLCVTHLMVLRTSSGTNPGTSLFLHYSSTVRLDLDRSLLDAAAALELVGEAGIIHFIPPWSNILAKSES
ncbi:hypothetical protein FOXYSP1_18518 [Fusarium oxysporum f. sp. phaseoli]